MDTVAFGEQLVKELGLDKGVDTLGRWLAHHIADLLQRTRKASGKDRAALEGECFERVLQLWEHRRASTRPLPMRNFDAIFDLLGKLADPHRRLYGGEHTVADASVERWLTAIDNVDAGARVIIDHFLSGATAAAIGKEERWIRGKVPLVGSSKEAKATRTLLQKMKQKDEEKRRQIVGTLKLFEKAARQLRLEVESYPSTRPSSG